MDIEVLASSSAGNAYRITDGTTGLLLDAGLAWSEIQRRMNFRTSELAGVLITHEHMDHSHAARYAAKAGLDIYASSGTFAALGLAGHRYHPIEAGKQFRIGTWRVLPFDVTHDAAEPLGFLLASGREKLLYLTDTAYCKYTFPALTHILAEANYATDILDANVAAGALPPELRNRIMQSHMSLETLKDLLRANDLSQVEEIILLHLSNGNADAARFKREIAALTGKLVCIAD